MRFDGSSYTTERPRTVRRRLRHRRRNNIRLALGCLSLFIRRRSGRQVDRVFSTNSPGGPTVGTTKWRPPGKITLDSSQAGERAASARTCQTNSARGARWNRSRARRGRRGQGVIRFDGNRRAVSLHTTFVFGNSRMKDESSSRHIVGRFRKIRRSSLTRRFAVRTIAMDSWTG